MNTTLREFDFFSNTETNIIKNKTKLEPDFYKKGLSGIDLHELRISKKASERALLDLSRLSEKQVDSLARCGSLCWCCQHSTDLNCGWFQNFKPVPGWIATPERYLKTRITYMVYDCPNFSRTVRFTSQKDALKDEIITYKVDIAEDILIGNVRV